MEQLPSPGRIFPLNLLKLSSSTAKDGALAHGVVGICPVKLLLLALSAIKFSIAFHVVDGNCPVNKLLEMLSTCRGCAGVEDGSSCSAPVRRLKLTSRTIMLLDDTNSSGKVPDSELRDRLRRKRPVRLPTDGEMDPSRPREASETSVTFLTWLQVIPSHVQQSVLLRHDAARPPSRESPARSWRREPFSCSVQELVGEIKVASSIRAKPREGMWKEFLGETAVWRAELAARCCGES
ncbi:hypothetical protein CFC21_091889 [Triticum aestivum]|uniref:Uncharacterized protein n=2 Tax=Triticum aestivum TaxID=4565 RepID=A0A3B6QBY9_WHEAT|nr:hypothetical protein CFC21_091889 [Triticum aestivum]